MTRNRASAKKAGATNAGSHAAAMKQLAIPFEDRIEPQIERNESGCWLWTGYKYPNGYAVLCWQGKQQLLHRLSYGHFVGPIPEGLVIDHLCRTKNCINPAHLEPVTSGENTRRAMRTHCVNGHEFTEANIYRPSDGKRYCRICRRTRVREYQERKRLAKEQSERQEGRVVA